VEPPACIPIELDLDLEADLLLVLFHLLLCALSFFLCTAVVFGLFLAGLSLAAALRGGGRSRSWGL